jgi:peptide/nickel transport system substrate-binding protein
MTRAWQPTAANPSLLRRVVGAAQCLESKDPTTDCDASRGLTFDDTTGRLTIHLTEPDPELLEKLALLVFPVPEGTPTENQGWAPVPGTGPYLVASANADEVTLTRNPYFEQWSAAARPQGYPDVITTQIRASESESVARVLDGTVAGAFAYNALPVSVTSRPMYIQTFEMLDLQMVSPNATVPPFDDRRVRQALNFAVDRRAAASLWGSNGEYATLTCQLIPPGIAGHRPYCPYQTGPPDGPYQGPDLDRARALVAESGTTGMPIVVHHDSYPALKSRAEYTASVLRELGYQVSVQLAEPDAPKSVTDRYQIQVTQGWIPDYPLPGTYYDTQVGCGQPTYTHYCNPRIQAVADRARALRRSDPAQSLSLWADVHQMLVDDGALVPLVSRVGTHVVNPVVGNVLTRAGFGPLLDQMWVR